MTLIIGILAASTATLAAMLNIALFAKEQEYAFLAIAIVFLIVAELNRYKLNRKLSERDNYNRERNN